MIDPEIIEEIGPLLNQLLDRGYRPVASSFSAEAFGNWVVDLDGPQNVRLVKDRGQYMVSGDTSALERGGLCRVFDDPDEFAQLVLAWAKG